MDATSKTSDSVPASRALPDLGYNIPKVQPIASTKSSIEKSLDEFFQKIRGTIEGMANDILRLGNPKTKRIVTRWDLQPVQIDVTGTIFKPHPCIDIFREETPNCNNNRQIYAPVITIPLPPSVLATDNRVKLVRDAILYDQSGEFRGPIGIPLRRHPTYCQFTLEFVNQLSPLLAPNRSLWCPSTAVYMPDPTTSSEEDASFTLYDTWNAAGLRDWISCMANARKPQKKDVVSKKVTFEDEGTQNEEVPTS
ncbi:hypothetical protein F4806DRAFT_495907 [Annulohypoxylon nitens]|nr:hypothetical protein F4806DRAFT_495907 [Annulohypoxylon nitens]